MSRQSVAQSVLNLFSCCALHDDGHCNIDCLHGTQESSCMLSNGRGESVCQKIVCCKDCPYWDYTKQTRRQHINERIFMAKLLGCSPQQAGLQYKLEGNN